MQSSRSSAGQNPKSPSLGNPGEANLIFATYLAAPSEASVQNRTTGAPRRIGDQFARHLIARLRASGWRARVGGLSCVECCLGSRRRCCVVLPFPASPCCSASAERSRKAAIFEPRIKTSRPRGTRQMGLTAPKTASAKLTNSSKPHASSMVRREIRNVSGSAVA